MGSVALRPIGVGRSVRFQTASTATTASRETPEVLAIEHTLYRGRGKFLVSGVIGGFSACVRKE